MSKTFTVNLEIEKETKNTIRYKEIEDGPPILGTQYMQKWVSKELGQGQFAPKIAVTITAA